ncbi:MAG: hypothetical protein H6Q72_3129 [Firmicutes bacterium]|nr:hypothetical protein [Bacillota bacterium]
MLKKIIVMACLILSLPSLCLAEEWKDKKANFSLIKHIVVLGPLNNVKEATPSQESLQSFQLQDSISKVPSNSSRTEALSNLVMADIYAKESKRRKNVLISATDLKAKIVSLDNLFDDKESILNILSQPCGAKCAEALLVIEINDSGSGQTWIPESTKTQFVNRPYYQTMTDYDPVSRMYRTYQIKVDNYVPETVTIPAHYQYYGWAEGRSVLYDGKTGSIIWSYSGKENNDKMRDAVMHFIRNTIKKLPVE